MQTKMYHNAYDIARYNIRKYRKLKGYTQQQLADTANLSHGYIRAVESEKVRESFSLDTLERIAIALEIEVKDLFDTSELN